MTAFVLSNWSLKKSKFVNCVEVHIVDDMIHHKSCLPLCSHKIQNKIDA